MGYSLSTNRLRRELLLILVILLVIAAVMGGIYWYDTQYHVVGDWAQQFYSFLLRE